MTIERLKSWLTAAEAKPRGLTLLSNLVYDVRDTRIPRGLARELLKRIADSWPPDARGRDPLSVFSSVISDSPEKFLFCGQKSTPIPARLCRVVSDAVLAQHNLRVSLLGQTFDDHLEEWVIDDLEEHGIPTGCAKGELRGMKPIAWVTRSNDLGSLEKAASVADPPGRVRNALGLEHYQDDRLVEVRYPKKHTSILRPPTVLDGGPNLVYRSKRKHDGWGRAVDLADLSEGLPEALHQPCSFTEKFRIRRIGQPTSSTPRIDFKDLVVRCPTPWDSKVDRDYLIQIAYA